MALWNELDIFDNDSLQSNIWRNLDDNLYNNHFMNGQCSVAVSFANKIESGKYNKSLNIPCYPEKVNFANNTNYASTNILGRPGDISGYTGTSDITTRFSFHLHRELEIPNNIGSDKNKIDELVIFIMSCNYPLVTQNGMYIPIVHYTFGDTHIIGKQTSLDIEWSGPKIGNAYMECTINLGVTHTFDFIPYHDSINNKLLSPRTLL